jgi:hypothetical protein
MVKQVYKSRREIKANLLALEMIQSSSTGATGQNEEENRSNTIHRIITSRITRRYLDKAGTQLLGLSLRLTHLFSAGEE